MTRIQEMPACERPREKLLERGAESLSDLELLAVVLGNGTQGHDVFKVAGRILKLLDEEGTVDVQRLQELQGVGPAKATLLNAALEFARRRIRPEGLKIALPSDVLPLIQHYCDRKQEHFLCVSLNGAHEVIATRVVSVGLVNRTQVHPREVYADPITDRATSIIVAHNHPSGCVEPSPDDRQVTRRLQEAGKTLGIELLDHIIFARQGFFSFRENDLL